MIKRIKILKEYSIEIINVLDDNYGENRDIDKDLGGYVLVVESVEDLKNLKIYTERHILEYTDEIKYSDDIKKELIYSFFTIHFYDY